MNPRRSAFVLGLAALGLALGASGLGQASALPADAARVAREFLTAFSRNDRETIKGLLPRNAANLYGPCAFARMPSLMRPRADGRVGAIEFAAPSVDSALPHRGIIILRRVEQGGTRSWRVRQIYWYEELPRGNSVPEESPTAADRRQEPAVRSAALEFLRAWLREDYAKMADLTFEWWEVPRKPPRWVKMTSLAVRGHPTNLDGLRVDFDATVRFLRVLPRHISGNVWLVKEDGRWRVRPITLSFLL